MTTRRILVIDDDPALRQLIEDVFLIDGCEVRAAEHGAAALSMLDGWQPDVILMDMLMPVMNGWDFAQQYRTLTGPHAPIVAMGPATYADGFAAEIAADDVLPKPFDLDDLLGVVQRATARSLAPRPESPPAS